MNTEYKEEINRSADLTDECSYCGSALIVQPSERAEDVCTCPGAAEYRRREECYTKLKTSIEDCCGEGCEQLYPLHKPLGEEELTAVIHIARMIADEAVSAAVLTLTDGTTLKLSALRVERRAVSKHSSTVQ